MTPHGPGTWQEFALALAVMGVLFLSFPGAAPIMGAALVLGSLYGLEQAAKDKGIPGPLEELSVIVAGNGAKNA